MKSKTRLEMKQVVLQMGALVERARALHSAPFDPRPHDAPSHTLPYTMGRGGAKDRSQ